ncbi:MAG: hypothetical protein JKZ00_05725 [Flavobacteriaceae bacterium]|nr:hypothetical protein [Flavobacteriaceae bacterium]
MKNAILALLCLISMSNLFAQDKVILTFNDGSEIFGYGRIKINDKIVYRKLKKGKKKIYNYKKVKKITVFKDSTKLTYEYKIVLGTIIRRDIKLLPEPIIKGAINLYQKQINGITSFGGIGGGTRFSHTYSYISKKGKTTVRYLSTDDTTSKKFKRFASTYFSDCPDLISKINSNYFKESGIKGIVKYYNKNCNKPVK